MTARDPGPGRCRITMRAPDGTGAMRTVVFYTGSNSEGPGVEQQVERAFTAERAMALAGVSKRQLQYWDERGFVTPSISPGEGRGRPRLYDFRDVLSLRVVADLRQQGISLQELRKVADHLRSLSYERPLAEIRLWVWGGLLYFTEAETIRAGRRPEQTIVTVTIPLTSVVDRLRSDVEALDRAARRPGRIEGRRGALGSKAVFAGTRIPVATVRSLMAAGLVDADIAELYPDLGADDLQMARGRRWRESPSEAI